MYLNSSFIPLLPAMIVVVLGIYIRLRTANENFPRRWMLFLFAITALLYANQIVGLRWENYMPGALLQPALFGVQVALVIHLAKTPQLWSGKTLWLTLSIALVTLILAVYWSLKTDPILLFSTIVAVFAWVAWEWQGLKRWLALLVLIFLVLEAVVYILEPNLLLMNKQGQLEPVIYLGVLFILPVAAVVWIGRQVTSYLVGDPPRRWPILVIRLGLSVLLLLLITILTVTETVWVQAEDSLTILPLFIFLAAMAAAMLMAWALKGWRRLGALVFVLLLTLLANFADQQGWRLKPTSVTETRAEKINRAIQRYYENRGSYPASLSDLTPAYLLLIPQPMIYRDQTWCYESGPDFFRLGYVHQPAFGASDTNITIRIAASEGVPPEPGWPCDQALARARSKFP